MCVGVVVVDGVGVEVDKHTHNKIHSLVQEETDEKQFIDC